MLTAIARVASANINNRAKRGTGLKPLELIDSKKTPAEAIALPYQKLWLSRKDQVAIDEKSRQIGWSFTHALRAVYRAINGRSSIYASYNKDSAKQFIKDCYLWAKLFNVLWRECTKTSLINTSGSNVFCLNFTNGESITAISGNSENLRAKPGMDIYLDELAYRIQESIDEILAAAMATLIRGGTIRGGSTHAGINSDFHKLIENIKKGVLGYGTTRITFDDAIADGMYKQIARKDGIIWTPEQQKIWVAMIRKNYGIRASEELDVIPGDFSGEGKVVKAEHFQKVNYTPNRDTIFLRYYDLASSIKKTSFYSASVLVAVDLLINKMIIIDYDADQLNPIDAHQRIIDHMIGSNDIVADPIDTFHIVEQEPGSTAGFYIDSFKQACPKNIIYGYAPRISKLKRGLPVGRDVANGDILILDKPWANTFCNIVSKFDGTEKPLVNDLFDCLSGIRDFWRNGDHALSNYNSIEDECEAYIESHEWGIY